MNDEERQLALCTLRHAVTRYDRRQEGRKGYNPYALGLYMGAVGRVEQDLLAGASLRGALVHNFNGRLLDFCLKSLKLETYVEKRGAL